MEVSGENAYLTNKGLAPYEIAQIVMELSEEDFVRSFAYDGAAHKPVLSSDAEPETKVRLTFKRWKRKSGSKWVSIDGAPTLPGTYRVNVIIVPKDANYAQIVLKRMEFRITGEVKTPQKANPDLTVTDKDGNPAAYTVQVITPDAISQDASSIYLITCASDKTASAQNKDTAEEADHYSQRCLNITRELLDKLEKADCKVLRFALGDAAIEMDVETLKAGVPYRLELAPLENGELHSKEEELLRDYETAGGLYAVRLSRIAGGREEAVPEEITLTADLKVLPEEKDQVKGCLFLKEDRLNESSEAEASLVTGDLNESEDAVSYSAQLGTVGVFCLVRETGTGNV